MPPEETPAPEVPQPISESPSPATEAPTPEPAPSAPEPTPAPVEAVPDPETAPTSAEASAGTQPTTPTAQIPPDEPLAPEPEPFDSAQNKPTTPESSSSAAPTPTSHIRDFLTKARVATQDRKRKKRDKIMAALNTKNKITNDEVEKLLHVSDATATRYLSALEKEGKIIQVGKQGKGILYIKTP